MKILLVDDDDGLRSFLAKELEARSYEANAPEFGEYAGQLWELRVLGFGLPQGRRFQLGKEILVVSQRPR